MNPDCFFCRLIMGILFQKILFSVFLLYHFFWKTKIHISDRRQVMEQSKNRVSAAFLSRQTKTTSSKLVVFAIISANYFAEYILESLSVKGGRFELAFKAAMS